MANIPVTPAGNQLFEVDIEIGTSARTVEVAERWSSFTESVGRRPSR